MRSVFALCLLPLCATTPADAQVAGVYVELDNGVVMYGEAYPDPYQGSFVFAGGRLECLGYYDAWDMSQTISVSFDCTRGVWGTASLVRDYDLQSGAGYISFSNGWSGVVSYGY